MQSFPSSGAPRVLRCPQCGAPLDAPPHALTARCGYCGQTVKLAEPAAALLAPPVAGAGSSRGVLLAIVALAVVVLAGGIALVVFVAPRAPKASDSKANPTTPAASRVTPEPDTPSPAPRKPPREKSTAMRYPLRSLLGVSTAVDIDGSRAHMLGLFPSVNPERRADELDYRVPLEHPWFDRADLGWKNERGGKLTSVAFKPPLGDEKFKNQDQIGQCLARGLGKPEVRETDHLAGEKSYFWGKHFPKAWANLYSSYLWLTFENPKGIAPVTLESVVRTLDACAAESPR